MAQAAISKSIPADGHGLRAAANSGNMPDTDELSGSKRICLLCLQDEELLG